MNRFYISTFLFFATIVSTAQSLNFAYPLGGSGSDMANDVVILSDNSIVIVGRHANAVTLSPTSTPLVSYAGDEAYVAKYSPDGTVLWAQQYIGWNNENIVSVCADDEDNIYLLGTFSEQVFSMPDSLGYTSSPQAGATDLFISKITTNGQILWSKPLSGSGNDVAGSIEYGPDGYIYVTGGCNGSCRFNTNNYSLINYEALGSSDVFVAKYSTDGAYMWFEANGGAGTDLGVALDFLSDGTVVCSGRIEDINLTEDCFLATLTNEGATSNIWFISGTGNTLGRSLAIDAEDNIYIGGYITGSADFDLLSGVTTGTAIGGYDMFTAKYSASGTLQWHNVMGSTANDVAQDIEITQANELIIAGYINNLCNVNPSGENIFFSTVGQHDAFIGTYTLDGLFSSGQNYGSTGIDYINRIAIQGGTLAVCGVLEGTTDFTWGAGETFVNTTDDDGFIAVFDLCNQELINTLSTDGNTLTANQSDAQYQWINCDTMQLIEGATSQSYTATESGSYAVQIQLENCLANSDCQSITVTSVNERSNAHFEIFPNPANTTFNMTTNTPGTVCLFNNAGQKVICIKNTQNPSIDVSTLSSGIYTISFETNESIEFRTISIY